MRRILLVQYALLSLFLGPFLVAQQLSPGVEAPPIVAAHSMRQSHFPAGAHFAATSSPSIFGPHGARPVCLV